MPRRKSCQHPTRHANSSRDARGDMAVSLALSEFLREQYDTDSDRVSWLCPRCHSIETKEMTSKSPDEDLGRQNSLNQRSSPTTSSIDDEDNHDTGEKEEQSSMDDDDDDYENVPESDREGDAESMEGDQMDGDYHFVYLQQQAMKKLSSIFKLLDIAPIHDKSVVLMAIIKFLM